MSRTANPAAHSLLPHAIRCPRKRDRVHTQVATLHGIAAGAHSQSPEFIQLLILGVCERDEQSTMDIICSHIRIECVSKYDMLHMCVMQYIYDKHVCTMYVFMCVFGVIVFVCVDVCKATLAVQNWCCPMFQHCEFLTTSAYSNREYTIHKQAWRQPRHNKRKLF